MKPLLRRSRLKRIECFVGCKRREEMQHKYANGWCAGRLTLLARSIRPRALVVSCITVLLGLTSHRTEGQEWKRMHAPREQARSSLAHVERWGCQYQNIEPQLIAASSLDLIVIDPILDGGTMREADPNAVSAMQGKPDSGRRLVFAYLSVGAAEEYRPYWNSNWGASPPAWLGAGNPEWPRSHTVRFWHAEWQQIVTDSLKKIVAAGFDGVFLDRVDAYHDWRDDHAAAPDDMAAFVVQLAQTAREQRPDFLLIGQNAEHLLAMPHYRNAIDAVSKESLLTGLQGKGVNNRPDQIAWSMNYLMPGQRSGLTILTIEYLDEQAEIERIRRRHRAMGFVPFFGTRLLDRLP